MGAFKGWSAGLAGAVVLAVTACGGSSVSGGGSGSGTVVEAGSPGNPDGHCTTALPSEAQAVDTSSPAHVVGTGTASSCTFDALAAAVAQGGVITFDCGADPVTIAVTSTLALQIDRDTVIDGGGKVTLDGQGKVRILSWNSANWMANTHVLTLQKLTLARGKATPTEAIPAAPSPCSQGWDDGQGGGVYMRDGALRAIDVTFEDCEAATLGPDTGGGAVYLLGVKLSTFVRCSFLRNQASNGGGLGSLFAPLEIYDSLFDGDVATGHDANNDDASKCSVVHAGQHQTGSGGNGGAIYNDGVGTSLLVCGTQIRASADGTNAFGAAIFMTSNDSSNKGSLTLRDCWFHDNISTLSYWQWKPGISTNANTPDPVNSTIE